MGMDTEVENLVLNLRNFKMTNTLPIRVEISKMNALKMFVDIFKGDYVFFILILIYL